MAARRNGTGSWRPGGRSRGRSFPVRSPSPWRRSEAPRCWSCWSTRLQVARLAARQGVGRRASWERALFTVLAKFPEATGVAEFRLMRLRGGRTLIEYK